MSTRAFKNTAFRLAPILTIGALFSAGALAAEDPLGSLVGSTALGQQLKEDYGVKVYGWAQAGLI
ncbi:TPA: outer membrane beta-barrel protein, partial [Pseudomonas aeruginosa]